MGDVLPLCASPQTVSNQTGRLTLKTVATFFKTFRWAWPSRLGGPPNGDRPLVVGIDFLWWIFGVFPFSSMIFASMKLTGIPYFGIGALQIIIWGFLVDAYLMLNIIVLYSVVYWHQNDPFLLMGAKAKFMIEVIPMISAATLRNLLGFNCWHISLLLSCTSYFYIYAHFLHVAYDIGVIDVLLGIGMQVLVYLPDAELLVRASAFSFCFVLCLCRYMMYRAPELPARCKKELEELPC